MKRMTLDYLERVRCNTCRKMVEPSEGTFGYIYLQDIGEPDLLFPRCKECADKEEADEQAKQSQKN